MTEHVHVSERHTGPWVLCTECSTVMWQRATGKPVPATWGEACALRRAEGPDRICTKDGSSAAQLRVGIKVRWNRNPPQSIGGWSNLATVLVPGTAAVVMGSNQNMDAHWRRWDPGFRGRHAVEVERLDGKPRVWLDDPLAPEGIGYQGEWVSLDQLAMFVNGWKGARHLVAAMPGWSGGGNEPVPLLAMKPTEQLLGTAITNPAGTSYIYADGTRLVIAGDTVRNVLGVSVLDKPIDDRPGDRSTLLLVSVPGIPGWGYLLADDTDWPAHKIPINDNLTARRAEYDLVLAGIGIPPRP